MHLSTQVTPAAGLIDIDATFLPTGHMRQVSRVTEIDGPMIAGEVDLGSGHWVYGEHLPGDPIFPGTLMIEAAGQLVALWAWSLGQRGRPRLVRAEAEFLHGVEPHAPRLTLRAQVRRKRNIQFASVKLHAGETEVATVNVVLAVMATPAPS
jgi:3-hydroxymyristoyl/3-hydroxydecanoyl-(acyl carrier protein) dehydratase